MDTQLNSLTNKQKINVLSHRIKKRCNKTLGTSVIKSQVSPPSRPCLANEVNQFFIMVHEKHKKCILNGDIKKIKAKNGISVQGPYSKNSCRLVDILSGILGDKTMNDKLMYIPLIMINKVTLSELLVKEFIYF